jgi:hypothetical protein
MFIVDALLKPVDTYWRTRYHAEEIRANKASADLKYAEAIREEQERQIATLTESDLKQRTALDAFAKEVEALRQQLKERDHELQMTREVLAAERRASRVYAMTERLFETVAKKEAQ